MNSATQLLIRLGGPTISELVSFLSKNLNKYETIECYEWSGDLWYVDVKFYPLGQLLGFTVHLGDDVIFWANSDQYAKQGFTRGGNCYCRSERWWRKIVQKYGSLVVSDRNNNKGTVHDYRRTSGVKVKAGRQQRYRQTCNHRMLRP